MGSGGERLYYAVKWGGVKTPGFGPPGTDHPPESGTWATVLDAMTGDSSSAESEATELNQGDERLFWRFSPLRGDDVRFEGGIVLLLVANTAPRGHSLALR
jgi:hypothetical protein